MSGRVFAGARALYRAAGVSGDDMGKKPIIAIANSFDEFLPGHVHLNKVGRIVSEAIKEAGGIPREFNTMAVDDGIAMGHTGMLYSLPSRDIIADTVEYQCNAHCADALICIPNCDKVVPGMLMAALRLNIRLNNFTDCFRNIFTVICHRSNLSFQIYSLRTKV